MKKQLGDRNGRPKFALSRRGFCIAAGTGILSARMIATSRYSYAEEAAPLDVKGTGQVIVPDAGGAFGDALRKAFYEPFEAASGIKVVLSPGSFDTGVILAGVKAGAPAYDIANVNGGSVYQYISEKAIVSIDYGLWPERQKKAIGPVPATDWAVPSQYFMLQPAWNTKQLPDATIKSWADVWNVEAFPGKRALAPGSWGAGGGTFEAALLADGVPADKLYPLDFDRAFASLDKLKPHLLKYWQTGAEPLQLLFTGQVSVASAWNGRVFNAASEGAPVKSSWSDGILQYDAWVVFEGAANRENAMKFLAWINQPAPQAEFARQITYSPANLEAFELLDKERADLLPTAPKYRAQAIVQDYQWWSAMAPGKSISNKEYSIQRWREWTEQ